MARYLLGLAALAAVSVVVVVTPIHAQDLAIEWLSTRAAADGVPLTTTVYDLAVMYGVDDHAAFTNYFDTVVDPSTPGQLFINWPLLSVPFSAIHMAAVWVSLVSGALIVYAIARFGVPWQWAAAGFAVLLVTYPGFEQLQHGQFSFLAVALLGLSWAAAKHGDGWLAGLPVGLIIGVKFYLWLVIPALWVAGRRRAALSAAASAVAANVAGWVLFDLDLADLIRLVSDTTQDLGGAANNGSLAGFGLPLWPVVAAALVVVWQARSWEFDCLVSLTVAVSLLASPIAWTHYLPVILVGLVALRRWWVLAGVMAVWVIFDPWSLPSHALLTVASCAVVIAATVQQAVRVRRESSVPAVV